MNSKEVKNLKLAFLLYKNVCMSIHLFTDILKSETGKQSLTPITTMDILKAGLYGYVDESKVWVSKKCHTTEQTFYIKVSNLDDISATHDSGWSPLIKLEDFDQTHNLKALW